ncbi:unnamed protein product [Triticum turgidum subsp. durum]|uniref:Uncharacterized protein n=1 Tax=Triticum turgidum subsp. durum TaxID=4567 RepID=A0A9R0SD03_TRITD|nr:unnamed protein product [Triticum turgidum subsp. durum]
MVMVKLAVAGWFVSVCLSKLADPVIQYAKDRYKDQKNFVTNTEKLKWRLEQISEAISRAREREVDDSKLQSWIQRLRDAVFTAEDVLDSIKYAMLKHQVTTEHKHIFSPRKDASDSISQDKNDADNLTKVIKKLDNVSAEMRSLWFLRGQDATQGLVPDQAPDWRETTASDTQPKLVGRQKEANDLMTLLLELEQCKEKISHISVVGMGGVGKTALVREAYNDNRTDCFGVKAWICVSHRASITRVLIDATNAASKKLLLYRHPAPDKGTIKSMLADVLKDKRFLIVLDDIWDWDLSRNILDAFNMPFSQAREGSKVIVTTRDPSIGEGMSTEGLIHVHGLEFKHYWPLFKELAFHNKDPEDYPELLSIGKNIAKRLNGLPQAAETFCQALRSDFKETHWRGISKRKMCQMGAEKCGIMATLRLSHEQLPRDLKECFVSCSLFPKGYAFQKEEVIRVWMALGYLDGPGAGVQRMKDIGKSIFTQLLKRSFFKENNEAPGTYIIPEPLDELAEFLVVVGQISSGSKKLDLIQTKTLQKLLTRMKCLPVLMVSEPLLADLPELKHLRYLEIHVEDNDGNASLPESICKLYQLQTLIARFCGNKLSIPENFNQLISLQFLETEPEAVCTIADIGKLTSLQEINTFEVGNNDKFGISQLENMDQVHGNLCIKGLEIVENKNEALKAKLCKKEYIGTLDLCWNIGSKERTKSMMTAHYEVLEGLQPHCNLSKLIINGYTGIKPPNWLKGAQAQELNLKCIELSNCSGWEDLPPFGILPYLKVLYIRQMRSLRRIEKEIYGQDIPSGFPQLHELLLEDLCNLEEWSLPSRDTQVFPKLRRLSITNCDNLKEPEDLPYLLKKLESLAIKNCPNIDKEYIRPSMTRPVYCQKPASQKRKVADKSMVKKLVLSHFSFMRNIRQKRADVKTDEKL